MQLRSWVAVDEGFQTLIMNEEWRMYSGYKYDEAFMKQLAEGRIEHAQEFLSRHRKPRRLFLKCVRDVADAAKTAKRIELEKAHEKKIISTKFRIKGRPVNWNNWRQFSAFAKDRERQAVYDEFIAKAQLLTPIIQAMFRQSEEAHMKHGLNPLALYLENERLSLEKLRKTVVSLGRSAKKAFRDALLHYSKEILGREAEYYDDFYFFRGRVFKPLDSRYARLDVAREPLKLLRKLDFPVARLSVDTEDRPGKYASAMCIHVRVPDDVRLLVRPVSPFSDLEGSFHEFGHGMHFISIREGLSYWNKYFIANGIAEIFSTFLEGLLRKREFLTKELGISSQVAEETLARTRFMNLFFLVFYAANSLMKVEFWEKALSMAEADERWAQYAQEFMGLAVPGRYWQLHHVMPEYDLYSPSYMLAAVRATELDHYVTDRYGEAWWRERQAGKELRTIAAAGAAVDLDSFSKLDSNAYLKTLL